MRTMLCAPSSLEFSSDEKEPMGRGSAGAADRAGTTGCGRQHKRYPRPGTVSKYFGSRVLSSIFLRSRLTYVRRYSHSLPCAGPQMAHESR
jgi:hypothetical protein